MDPRSQTMHPTPSSAALPDLEESLELVQRFRTGHDEAFAILFERYRERLLRIIRFHMSEALRGRVEAEDILQETFLASMKSAPQFLVDSHAGILQWLSRVAQNRILDRVSYFAAQKRDAAREVPADASTPSQDGARLLAAPSKETPAREAARRELEQLLDQCLRALEPSEYRNAILHRDYYGASWEELCDVLGKSSPAAARELHRRAQVKLRMRMGRYFDRPED